MGNEITWESTLDAALERSRSENKQVFLQFFGSDCFACRQMDTVTYPDTDVSGFIEENFVPIKMSTDAWDAAYEHNINFTPTHITIDQEGKEHHRTVGFLSPAELIASLILGLGKIHFANDRFEEARRHFDKVLSEYPESKAVPESIFMRGVTLYKITENRESLKEAHEKLKAEHPESEWVKHADPSKLLPEEEDLRRR